MASVTDRFFQAVEELKGAGVITYSEFCKEIGVDRRNFAKQKADTSRRIIRVEWLSHIVMKYRVSAKWLLSGDGWIFGD